LLVGLIGGALTGCVGLTAMAALFKNVAKTYANFPSIKPPWLSQDLDLPMPILAGLFVLGFAGPLLMGLATARLVRSSDAWGDLSAGLTTCLASTLSSYAITIGAAVSIALVIVPSIADFTLVGELAKTPLQASAQPSDVLVQRYPELRDLPVNERGGVFFAKMVADQVVGSFHGVWLGIALALGSCGMLGLFGTLAGGWLLRRGGSWWSILISYAEVTVATSWTAGWLIAMPWMRPQWNPSSAGALLIVTALVLIGVVRRWNWLLRVDAALVWFLVLRETHLPSVSGWPFAIAAFLAYGFLAWQLGRLWFQNAQRPAVASI
jgi:hypothetical protein